MSQRSVGERVPASTFDEIAQVDPDTGAARHLRRIGDGRAVGVDSTVGAVFTDDFGGSTIDLARWDVLDGGLGVNPNLGAGALTQTAIGTGVAGITDAVSGSALTVNMGTTNNAERWYLSKTVFNGSDDITVILSRSQALAANSVFVGLVEVDPATGVPLLNPNRAQDFTNRSGIEFGQTTGTQTAALQSVADSSSTVASVSATFSPAAMTTTFEALVEINSEDVVATANTVDSVSTKSSGNAMRVSTQCPNPTKSYKLVMRFKNVAAPASNTAVVVQRVLVVDTHDQRVEVMGGRGDAIGQKAISANVTNTPGVFGVASTSNPGSTPHKLIAAAGTNATLVKSSAGKIVGGFVHNLSAATIFFKLFNKATAPVVGTDTPFLTIPIETGRKANLAEMFDLIGLYFSTGVAYAVTGGVADLDATALVANDAVVGLTYI